MNYMKTFKTILGMMLFAICFVACSNEESIKNIDDDVTKTEKEENLENKENENNTGIEKDTLKTYAISRDSAYTIAMKDSDFSLSDVDIWATKETLPANLTMEIAHFKVQSPKDESWLFFVDLIPMANWAHDCLYIFVDMNGNVSIHKETMPPGYDKYNMERIHESDFTKNTNPYPIPPKVSVNSRSASVLEHHYAIILSGGYDRWNNHIRYWNDCSSIYQTLINQYGYDPSKVYVLMADGQNSGIDNSQGHSSETDLDGDDIADIDYAATNENLNNVFDILASRLTDKDHLYIFTIDHGGLESSIYDSYICMWNQERFYASDFATKVKAINNKTTNIVMGQCHSGGFVDYFRDTPNVCISAACMKDELSWSTSNGLYDEYVYYWTQSHTSLAGDSNYDDYVTSLESHNYAKNRDSQNENPVHYGGSGNLSSLLTLTGMHPSVYGTYYDGYCVFNYETGTRYPFYADEPNHEPEFGIVCGDKIDITLTNPDINEYVFSWSVIENNNYTAVFVPNNTRAHMEVRSQSPIGQRIRVKVEANIPEDNYYLAQYINFYITSNYRIARSENNVLSIENVSTDNTSATYTLNASASTFNYQIMDEGTNNIRMSGSYPKNQKIELDISQLSSGVYTLIIRENGEIKANQRLTI